MEAEGNGGVVCFWIGNTCKSVEKNSYKWTLFVRDGDNVGDVAHLKEVIVKLHPTFKPNTISLTSPPFELSRKGWGTFPIELKIVLNDGQTHKVIHDLSFDTPKNAKIYKFPFKKPSVWVDLKLKPILEPEMECDDTRQIEEYVLSLHVNNYPQLSLFGIQGLIQSIKLYATYSKSYEFNPNEAAPTQSITLSPPFEYSFQNMVKKVIGEVYFTNGEISPFTLTPKHPQTIYCNSYPEVSTVKRIITFSGNLRIPKPRTKYGHADKNMMITLHVDKLTPNSVVISAASIDGTPVESWSCTRNESDYTLTLISQNHTYTGTWSDKGYKGVEGSNRFTLSLSDTTTMQVEFDFLYPLQNLLEDDLSTLMQYLRKNTHGRTIGVNGSFDNFITKFKFPEKDKIVNHLTTLISSHEAIAKWEPKGVVKYPGQDSTKHIEKIFPKDYPQKLKESIVNELKSWEYHCQKRIEHLTNRFKTLSKDKTYHNMFPERYFLLWILKKSPLIEHLQGLISKDIILKIANYLPRVCYCTPYFAGYTTSSWRNEISQGVVLLHLNTQKKTITLSQYSVGYGGSEGRGGGRGAVRTGPYEVSNNTFHVQNVKTVFYSTNDKLEWEISEDQKKVKDSVEITVVQDCVNGGWKVDLKASVNLSSLFNVTQKEYKIHEKGYKAKNDNFVYLYGMTSELGYWLSCPFPK